MTKRTTSRSGRTPAKRTPRAKRSPRKARTPKQPVVTPVDNAPSPAPAEGETRVIPGQPADPINKPFSVQPAGEALKQDEDDGA
jgi:hypothetical protein